eukprot:2371821-Rhodomonas_salina.1
MRYQYQPGKASKRGKGKGKDDNDDELSEMSAEGQERCVPLSLALARNPRNRGHRRPGESFGQKTQEIRKKNIPRLNFCCVLGGVSGGGLLEGYSSSDG